MFSDRWNNWWQPATNAWQIAFMRVASAAIWIAMAVELIQRIESGRLAYIVTGVGILSWISALLVGPQCWGIFGALPGSHSRNALTLMVLFGLLLQISGLIARFPI
jgi:hypothetical protein